MNARTRNQLIAAAAVAAVLVPLLLARKGVDAVASVTGAAGTASVPGTARAALPTRANRDPSWVHSPASSTDLAAATHSTPTAAASTSPAPAESDYLAVRSLRWEPQRTGRDDLGEPIVLVRAPSCGDSRFLGQSTTLQAVLALQLGVRNAADRERLFYSKDRRFFQRGGRFHQITASWDSLQPPRYRIEWFSAADAALTLDVRAEMLPPGTPAQADAIEAREILGALSPAGDTDEERAGSRFLSADLAASPSTPAAQAGFINGMPFAVGFDGGNCRVLASGEAAYCQCDSPSDGGGTHGH